MLLHVCLFVCSFYAVFVCLLLHVCLFVCPVYVFCVFILLTIPVRSRRGCSRSRSQASSSAPPLFMYVLPLSSPLVCSVLLFLLILLCLFLFVVLFFLFVFAICCCCLFVVFLYLLFSLLIAVVAVCYFCVVAARFAPTPCFGRRCRSDPSGISCQHNNCRLY